MGNSGRPDRVPAMPTALRTDDLLLEKNQKEHTHKIDSRRLPLLGHEVIVH
jgi:hypothetical protein